MLIPPLPRMGLALLTSLGASPLAAHGPDPAAPKEPESWAAESRPVALKHTPGQILVFEEEDILRSGARTLGEFLLRELPGQVLNEGGPGLPTRIYLAGSRPQDTTILLDGLPYDDPGRLGQDLSEIPLLGLTRVEVITGPTGIGGQGPGGTLALYTGPPGRPGVSGDVAGLGGNQGQGAGEATPGFAWTGGHLRVGSLGSESHSALETRRPYRQVSHFLSASQAWGPATWTFGWRGSAFGAPQPYQDATETLLTFNPDRESRQRSEASHLGVDWRMLPGWQLEGRLGVARFRHEQPAPGAGLATPFEGQEARFLAVLHAPPTRRSSLRLRLDAQDGRQDGDADPQVLGTVRGTRVGLGLEWTFEASPSLRWLGQVRVTRDRQSLEMGGLDLTVLRATGHSLRLGFSRELPGGFRVYGAASSGRTAPALLDQLRQGQTAGAQALGMERSTDLQVGLGWGRGAWSGRAESRQQTRRDLVGAEGTTLTNRDSVRLRATDLSLSWRPAKHLGIEGFARVQEARDLNASGDLKFSTAAVQRRPFSSHGLKGFSGWGPVRTELSYTLQGHQYSAFGDAAARSATNGLPPVIRATHVVYRSLAMVTTVQAGPHWRFTLRGQNLLQPKTTPEQWLSASREGQSDAYLVDGYPATAPRYALEARYRY